MITDFLKSVRTFFENMTNKVTDRLLPSHKEVAIKKSDRKFWKNRLKDILAQAELDELLLMKSLVDSNNTPQVSTFYEKSSRRIKVNNTVEYLYQYIDAGEDSYGDRYYLVRISVPVFSRFKKAFRKHGECRISGVPLTEAREQ